MRLPIFVALLILVVLSPYAPCNAWASEHTTGASNPSSEPALVAEGKDGFRVTERDVQQLTDFFTNHTMSQTTEKEYRRYTVQTFLFAREAERLGLGSEHQTLPQEPIAKQLALANIYLEHRLLSLQLEREAIQSYYRAFPERFLKDASAEKWRADPRAFIEEEDILPLEQVAPQIEAFIRARLRKRVEAMAFQELMTAYQVGMK